MVRAVQVTLVVQNEWLRASSRLAQDVRRPHHGRARCSSAASCSRQRPTLPSRRRAPFSMMSSTRQPRWSEGRILAALHAGLGTRASHHARTSGRPAPLAPSVSTTSGRPGGSASGRAGWGRTPFATTSDAAARRSRPPASPARPLVFDPSLPSESRPPGASSPRAKPPRSGAVSQSAPRCSVSTVRSWGRSATRSAIATSPSSTPRTTSVRAARVGCCYAPATFTATVFVRVYAIRASKPFSLP